MENKKTYTIEQFPKNKDIDKSKLSAQQLFIRSKKKADYQKNKECKRCGKKQPLTEYWFRDKKNGKRNGTCRDCQLKAAGVIEVGKHRFAKKIMDKGFRRCSVCKVIKPITEYKKSRCGYKGYSNNCYECAHKLHSEFYQKQKNELGISYIKEWGKRKGIKQFTDKILDDIRLEILESRNPKHFVDGKEFHTAIEFATYIHEAYGQPITATCKRLMSGRTSEECKLSEYEMRSRAYTKGGIKVTDTITGKIYWFTNTKDKGLTNMFSGSAIAKGIITGEPTRITSLSKYKNPCIIQRVTDELERSI